MELPKHITDRIEIDAEAKYPFVWPKNKHGEDMVQRVGQPPPFSRKWKNSLKMYIDGATTEATRAYELVKALEKISKLCENEVPDYCADGCPGCMAREALNKYLKPAK